MARPPSDGHARRRSLLQAAAGTAALVPGSALAPAHAAAAIRRLAITHSARPPPVSLGMQEAFGAGEPFHVDDFSMVGVFDVDWLLEARYTRLLDAMAASPGAFGGIRFFGALNSGEREDAFPTHGGGVWHHPDEPMDFAPTLDALAALTSRGLVPFVALTFFPPAVSSRSTEPPEDFMAWQSLVRGFLDRVADRFGPEEIAKWWFEVWNEPNMPPFWRGSFDRYLELYRATSQAVIHSGHAVRLGGPALAYLPSEGVALMERFLEFLRREASVKCDFLSLHRKGSWTEEEGEPRLERSVRAVDETARAALRLVPGRCRGLTIVNNEADMKVGFQHPYEPRLTERFPSWLAAQMIAYEQLSRRHATQGIRFAAASDNANQHLVREPFDGRRALMTRTAAAPDDLVKLPVFGFYELLRLLGDRHGGITVANAPSRRAGLFHTITVAEDRIGVLFTLHPEGRDGGQPVWIDYALRDIPWPRVNVAEFRIDAIHSNAYTAAGRRMPASMDADTTRRIRAAQELGVAAPIRRGLRFGDGRLRLPLQLDPFATVLVWITPFAPELQPVAPAWVEAAMERGNVLLRWRPSREQSFYSYEVVRITAGSRRPLMSPVPLRSAMWVDTAPPSGTHVYGVRVVSASGARSPQIRSLPVSI